MVKYRFWLMGFLFILLQIGLANAQTNIEQSSITGDDYFQTQINSKVINSKVWGITQEDWGRYEQIMKSKGKYFWKHLDPIIVLGLNARSEQERYRFAKLMAIQEYNNTENTIKLNRAYQKAFDELYGDIPIIDINLINKAKAKSNILNVSPAQVKPVFGDRYIVFANTHCKPCDRMVTDLLRSIELGVSIDIHFNSDSRKEIMIWAAKLGIPTDSVKAGTITLNPNSKLVDKFGVPAEPSLFYFNKESNRVSEVQL